jgi:hypothetical protein
MLSWEFLAIVSTFIAMSPWYSWRASPGCSASKNLLGDLEVAFAWYSQKLTFYRYYKREKVVEFFKEKMNTFYEDCPAAWQELLEHRVNASPVALATGYTASPGTTGTEQPRDEDIDDLICLWPV